MCGSATFAMEVSRASIKAANATVAAISHGFAFGFHRSLLSASIAMAALFCYRHLCMTMPVHAVGVFFALLSASRIPATNLLGPSSNVELAKGSHSPRLPAMETIGMRDPEARI